MPMRCDMKTIVCYGDSNTWGYIPGSAEERYPYDIRWTGVLQRLLGAEYHVIEEGLRLSHSPLTFRYFQKFTVIENYPSFTIYDSRRSSVITCVYPKKKFRHLSYPIWHL